MHASVLGLLRCSDPKPWHAGGARQLTARQGAPLRQRQAQQPEGRSLASRASTTAVQAAQGAKQLVAPITSGDQSPIPGRRCVASDVSLFSLCVCFGLEDGSPCMALSVA